MNDVTDHYAVLGLAPGAPLGEVKARFRQLAMAVHPDRNDNDPQCQERLRRLNAAYEFLSDSSRKADYDARRRSPTVSDGSARSSASTRSAGGGVMSLLALAVLCVLLCGLAAFLVFGDVSDPPIQAAPPPGVTIIELPSGASGPASRVVVPVSPADAGTADGGTVLPASAKGPWPAAPAPSPTSDLDTAPPMPAAPPYEGAGWPSAGTDSFPSR